MRLPLTVAILFCAAVGCRRPLGPYRDLEKWQLDADEDRRQLRDHPREVTEYNYKASDSDRPAKRRMLYKKYRFNALGDIIGGTTYFKDTIVVTWNCRFDASGFQETDSDLTTGRAHSTVTRPLGDGRYKTVEHHLDSPATASIRSFTEDGREFIRENFQDTGTRRKTNVVHIYYDGDRVAKFEFSDGNFDVEKRFFYSRWDSPDSIESSAKKLLISWYVEREYFLMNSHGDPIRHLRIAGIDTMQVEQFQYVYDLHGNWTRKLSFVLKNKVPGQYDHDPGIPRVVEREFIY